MKGLVFIKKFNFDAKYLKVCLHVLFVIIVAILFEKTISNVQVIKDSVSNSLMFMGKILAPFIFGWFIAFFLNPFVRWLENKVVTGSKISRKLKRGICSFFAILLFTGLILCVMAFILPEIIDSVYTLVLTLPTTISESEIQLEKLLEFINLSAIVPSEVIAQAYEPILNSFGSITSIISKIVTGTVGVGRILFNFAIGLIIAFYMLIYKDGFKSYFVKITYILFRPETAVRLINNTARVNNIFEGFFVGKTLDSAIIGVIAFVVMNFFIKPKYILLSSVIIGVTNMIPFFGPFIGAVPVIILALFYDIKMALILTVFIFLLQQFDGYILGPKILGDSTGLTPFWVIASILVGSALFGIMGMFLGVPIFAVIKAFFDEAVDKKFKEKYQIQQPYDNTKED